MKTTPEPTASATVHPSCPPSWACDTPDGDGLNASLLFAGIALALILLAAATNKGRS